MDGCEILGTTIRKQWFRKIPLKIPTNKWHQPWFQFGAKWSSFNHSRTFHFHSFQTSFLENLQKPGRFFLFNKYLFLTTVETQNGEKEPLPLSLLSEPLPGSNFQKLERHGSQPHVLGQAWPQKPSDPNATSSQCKTKRL